MMRVEIIALRDDKAALRIHDPDWLNETITITADSADAAYAPLRTLIEKAARELSALYAQRQIEQLYKGAF